MPFLVITNLCSSIAGHRSSVPMRLKLIVCPCPSISLLGYSSPILFPRISPPRFSLSYLFSLTPFLIRANHRVSYPLPCYLMQLQRSSRPCNSMSIQAFSFPFHNLTSPYHYFSPPPLILFNSTRRQSNTIQFISVSQHFATSLRPAFPFQFNTPLFPFTSEPCNSVSTQVNSAPIRRHSVRRLSNAISIPFLFKTLPPNSSHLHIFAFRYTSLPFHRTAYQINSSPIQCLSSKSQCKSFSSRSLADLGNAFRRPIKTWHFLSIPSQYAFEPCLFSACHIISVTTPLFTIPMHVLSLLFYS